MALDPFVFDYYVNLALCYRALDRETDTQDTILAARALAGDDPSSTSSSTTHDPGAAFQ